MKKICAKGECTKQTDTLRDAQRNFKDFLKSMKDSSTEERKKNGTWLNPDAEHEDLTNAGNVSISRA